MFWLIPFVVLAVALAATVALCLSLRREVRVQTRRQRRRVDRILARLDEASAPLATRVVPAGPRPGFNRIRRVEALRLLSRGEGAAHVAAALGISPAEVDLLIRVQGISAAAPGPARQPVTTRTAS